MVEEGTIQLISKAIQDVEEQSTHEQYGSIALLSRDYFEFLSDREEEEAKKFVELYNEHGQDVDNVETMVMNYGIRKAPMGFAAKSSVAPLDLGEYRTIVKNTIGYHEGLEASGRHIVSRFVKRYLKELKEVICGANGPYNQLENGLLTESDAAKTIVAGMVAGFTLSGFWIPLLAYIIVILVHAGLKMICEEEEDE